MASVIEYILGVSGSVLLVAWVALLIAAAVFWRRARTRTGPGGSPPAAGRVPPPASR